MKFDPETWLERAAIYEYDGGIPRQIADRWAMRLFIDDPQAETKREEACSCNHEKAEKKLKN